MQLDLATAEYIGARAQQQDLAAALPLATGAMLVLADGLGGHESGAEAARIVVETFREAGAGGRFNSPPTRRQALREALDLANARIAQGVDPSHGHRGMASTAVAAVISSGELSWVSVGDSHLYLWREGRLHKLNEDHSQAGLMVRSGQYQPSDPEVLAVKSVLVSALTGRKLDIVDLPASSVRLEPGDVLMLASDGLNTLADDEVERIIEEVSEHGAVKLSTTLLESVRSRRVERQDNTTVVVARILEHAKKPAVSAAGTVRTADAVTATVDLDSSDEARTERIVVDRYTGGDQLEPANRSHASLGDGESDADAGRAAAEAVRGDTAGLDAVSAKTPDDVLRGDEDAEDAFPPNGYRSVSRQGRPVVDDPARYGEQPDAVRGGAGDATEQAPGSGGRIFSVLILLVAVLLVGGVALAALKPAWLNGIVPGLGTGGALDPGGSAPIRSTSEQSRPSLPEVRPSADGSVTGTAQGAAAKSGTAEGQTPGAAQVPSTGTATPAQQPERATPRP